LSRHLHIVCLDVPWPADYGGAIDMMNRIKALHQLGIIIHLHYFSYNERGIPQQLNEFCETVNVYKRKTGWKGFSFSIPYIVQSRINHELISNLKNDDHPILIEGIHCTGIIPYLDKNRKIVVRMHNDETVYYKEMARATSSPDKKMYFRFERRLLKKYSSRLQGNCIYACISEKDKETFHKKYHLEQTKFLPAFPTWQTVTSNEDVGDLCLYHGNLSVPENEQAAIWLLEKVFSKIKLPIVIAGKKPSNRLIKLAQRYQHCCLVADPSEAELNDLISKAQVNVLPSVNKNVTGIRLKLLHAISQGRHCVVNESMVEGTGLEVACHIGKNANAFASIISQLFHHPFTSEEIVLRKKLLGEIYDNSKNAQQLITWLY
jgi:hypothetical protein